MTRHAPVLVRRHCYNTLAMEDLCTASTALLFAGILTLVAYSARKWRRCGEEEEAFGRGRVKLATAATANDRSSFVDAEHVCPRLSLTSAKERDILASAEGKRPTNALRLAKALELNELYKDRHSEDKSELSELKEQLKRSRSNELLLSAQRAAAAAAQ